MISVKGFLKSNIKDNNYEGIKLSKKIAFSRDDNTFNDRSNYNEDRIKKGIVSFIQKLHETVASQDIQSYIIKIVLNEEFDANEAQKLFSYSGLNFEDLKIYTYNIVGSMVFEGKEFNINCRFGNYFLEYMISSTSGFLELENFGTFDNETSLGEWILIYYWKLQLKQAFALGMYKTYALKSESISSVRGRINTNKYIQKGYFDGKIDCEYKEHNYDNIINSVILLTINKIFKHPKYSKLVQDIYSIKQAFEQMNTTKVNPARIDKNHKVLNPFYVKYNEVFELSMKILNNDFASIGNKNQNFSAFLFDISLLFEHHIRKLLQTNFTLFEKNKIEFNIPNGIGNSNLFPDVIIDHGENRISVFDVKYKHFNSLKGVDRNDRFQLVTYVATHLSKYEIVECGFIYPSNRNQSSEIKNIQGLNISGKSIPFKIVTYYIQNEENENMYKQKQAEFDQQFLKQFIIENQYA